MTTLENFTKLKFPLRIIIKIITKDGNSILFSPKNNTIPKKYCSKKYELLYLNKEFDSKGDYLFVDIRSIVGQKTFELKNEREALKKAIQENFKCLETSEKNKKQYLNNIKWFAKKLKLCEKALKEVK